MNSETLLQLLHDGGLTVYPLGVGSILALAILLERLWRFRGIDRNTRALTRDTIDCLVKRDVAAARSLCEKSKTPISPLSISKRPPEPPHCTTLRKPFFPLTLTQKRVLAFWTSTTRSVRRAAC